MVGRRREAQGFLTPRLDVDGDELVVILSRDVDGAAVVRDIDAVRISPHSICPIPARIGRIDRHQRSVFHIVDIDVATIRGQGLVLRPFSDFESLRDLPALAVHLGDGAATAIRNVNARSVAAEDRVVRNRIPLLLNRQQHQILLDKLGGVARELIQKTSLGQ